MPVQTARRYIQLFNALAEGSLTIADIAEAGQIGALKAATAKLDAVTEDQPDAPIWTSAQWERRQAAERGDCVVANMREVDGVGVDGALLAYAPSARLWITLRSPAAVGMPIFCGPLCPPIT